MRLHGHRATIAVEVENQLPNVGPIEVALDLRATRFELCLEPGDERLRRSHGVFSARLRVT